MRNEELYEKALEAVTELFSDLSVTKTETKDNLQDLVGEIESMLDSLD